MDLQFRQGPKNFIQITSRAHRCRHDQQRKDSPDGHPYRARVFGRAAGRNSPGTGTDPHDRLGRTLFRFSESIVKTLVAGSVVSQIPLKGNQAP